MFGRSDQSSERWWFGNSRGRGTVGLIIVVEVPASEVGGSTIEDGVETVDDGSDSSYGEAAGRDVIQIDPPEERLMTAVWLVTVVEVPASGVGGSTTEDRVKTADDGSGLSCGEAAGRYVVILSQEGVEPRCCEGSRVVVFKKKVEGCDAQPTLERAATEGTTSWYSEKRE